MRVILTPPEGVQYKTLIPGSIYRRFQQEGLYTDHPDRIWVVSPGNGDFFIDSEILSGQFASNKPDGESFVEPLGHLRFVDLQTL